MDDTKRFRELHADAQDAEEFLTMVEDGVLHQYLIDLGELIDTLAKGDATRFATSQSHFKSPWVKLIKREAQFERLVHVCNIEADKPLQEKASKLVFFLRHPMYAHHTEITHHQRVHAINATRTTAKTYLENLSKNISAQKQPVDEPERLTHERFKRLHVNVDNAEGFLQQAVEGHTGLELKVHGQMSCDTQTR
ncbi:hypothetical protein PSTT_15678 [Puccinia striiformis]|uniref:Uncharacterized protein n=1 Tax=Puccinia striiformis TaxID=27350 RepID=A0A2S4UGJ0_9BASI|nr:hypothetical protein PSTT_15678 [Puccinia striiformis]